MTFFKFKEDDIIHTSINAYPFYNVELKNDLFTGSIYLEKQYLNSTLENRNIQGYSQKKGGLMTKVSPLSASINIVTAVSGGTNNKLWHSIKNCLYSYYRHIYADYTTSQTSFRVIDIPTIYYDKEILTGSLTASDYNADGEIRVLYDNSRGGVFSGSLSGTLVGHIFYNEGFIVLTKADLQNFGSVSSEESKWKVSFKGTQNIPVQIYRCRAPAGELNASTNNTFYQNPQTGDYKNQKEIVLKNNTTYITEIGLFDDNYRLVAVAKLAQPIKKSPDQNILFRIRIDW